ncbi:MAG TPA: glycosyl hydrolase family 28 protein [Rhizomicrobium sp.]
MVQLRRISYATCFTLFIGSLAASPALAQAQVSFPDRICNVKDYGAEGYRDYPETEAFQKAIDDCAAKGGGTVEVPRGWWYVGPLTLKSNINFHIAQYADVHFATDPVLYGIGPDLAPLAGKREPGQPRNLFALIKITDAQNVAITGEGILDGQGYVWWEAIRKTLPAGGAANQSGHAARPMMLLAARTKNFLLEGVTIMNAPAFNVMLDHTEDVTIRKITIQDPPSSPNTDAIDPFNSHNVLIEDNVISCGDDIVAIKATGVNPAHPDAAVSNIVIRNNKIFAGHGISIGSDTSGGVKHVLIENNTFEGSFHGVRIKSRRGYGGEVSDIVIRNNKMKDVQNVLTIAEYFQYIPVDMRVPQKLPKGAMLIVDLVYPADTDPAQPYAKNKTPYFHDITIDGLEATGAEAVGIVLGVPEKEITNFTMKNVHIESKTGLIVRNATINAENTTITSEDGKPIVLQRHGRFKIAK